MIRRLALPPMLLGAVLLWAGAAQAQPYGGQDPLAVPADDFSQPPGYPDSYEGPARYDEPDQPGYAPDYEGPASYDEEEAAPAEDYRSAETGDDRGYAPARRDDSHYNSGASARGSSTYSRQSSSRSGSTYSSRSSASSQEAYVQGEYAEDDRGAAREDYGYRREGYARGDGYAEQRSGARTASTYSSSGEARFGYQRRFSAYSVAEERTEEMSVERREEYAYLRRDRELRYDEYDLRLDHGFTGGLNGGVEGAGPVMWAGGGGYASFSASASSFAGARAFAGARSRGGHRGKGHGCGCR